MAAPQLAFSVTGSAVSAVSGCDSISVTFSSDIAYTEFQCRATRDGAAYGVGVGTLVASFSATPAGTARTFEVYDDYLTAGDGAYRIGLYARGADGSWNDNESFLALDAGALRTSDGDEFLSVR